MVNEIFCLVPSLDNFMLNFLAMIMHGSVSTATLLLNYVNNSVFQIQSPVVCGIASLGYDHMEILG